MVDTTSVPDEPFNSGEWERKFAIEAAIKVSQNSNLPGRENGPADAYRHVLWAGELARRFGETGARAILAGHEWQGRLGGQSSDAEAMDRHNNELGISIGKGARTWGDVIAHAQRLMDESDRSGTGAKGQARWLAPARWRKNPVDRATNQPIKLNWPESDWVNGVQHQPYDYPFGGEDYRYPDERGSRDDNGPPLARPVETWSKDDVRQVMLSRAYHHPGSPDHDLALGKVRAWFEYTYGNAPAPVDATGRISMGGGSIRSGSAGGGSVHVSAHSREGGKVSVSAYDRSPPSR
jgi:hypothetical protein